MTIDQLVKDAIKRLKPQYQHYPSGFPVPPWHAVAEALKLGWGFPYEFSTSPSGDEAAVSFDPETGRTVSIARDPESSVYLEAWFDHEIDPYGANPSYYKTDSGASFGLIKDAAFYLAHGEED
nr:MAG TPA: hypothetical protein [Caudoviricetes sp.]